MKHFIIQDQSGVQHWTSQVTSVKVVYEEHSDYPKLASRLRPVMSRAKREGVLDLGSSFLVEQLGASTDYSNAFSLCPAWRGMVINEIYWSDLLGLHKKYELEIEFLFDLLQGCDFYNEKTIFLMEENGELIVLNIHV